MLTPEAAKSLDAAQVALTDAAAQQQRAEEQRRAAVIAARESGATLTEIGRRLHLTTGRVSQIIRNTR